MDGPAASPLRLVWDACRRAKSALTGNKLWTGPGPQRDKLRPPGVLTDHSFRFGTGDEAVLLVHGLTGSPKEMRHVGKGLAARGYIAYGMQLAGHGGTELDLLCTNWRDWYASVEAAYLDLASRHDTVYVAGLSLGAILALHLAARHPVAGVALYSPMMWYNGWAVPRLQVVLPLLLATRLGDYYRFEENFPYGIKDPRLRNLMVSRQAAGHGASLPGMPGASLREMRALVAEVQREVSGITTPTLILHSREDDLCSLSNAEYLEKRLAGPVRMVVLDDCYHVITVDRQRHKVVDETVSFFQALRPAAGLTATAAATA